MVVGHAEGQTALRVGAQWSRVQMRDLWQRTEEKGLVERTLDEETPTGLRHSQSHGGQKSEVVATRTLRTLAKMTNSE